MQRKRQCLLKERQRHFKSDALYPIALACKLVEHHPYSRPVVDAIFDAVLWIINFDIKICPSAPPEKRLEYWESVFENRLPGIAMQS